MVKEGWCAVPRSGIKEGFISRLRAGRGLVGRFFAFIRVYALSFLASLVSPYTFAIL